MIIRITLLAARQEPVSLEEPSAIKAGFAGMKGAHIELGPTKDARLRLRYKRVVFEDPGDLCAAWTHSSPPTSAVSETDLGAEKVAYPVDDGGGEVFPVTFFRARRLIV